MKVAHVTSAHSVFAGRIFSKEAKTLHAGGVSVCVVGPHEKSLEVDGLRIFAVAIPGGRVKRILFTPWALLHKCIKEKVDVIHFHDPDILPLGFLFKLMGKKVVYDVHEDVPTQMMAKDYIPFLLRWIFSKLASAFEWMAGIFFDGFVVATPTIGKRFPKRKTCLVQNFPRMEEFGSKGLHILPYHLRPENIVYVGGLAKIRGLIEMLEAFEQVKKVSNAKLVLAGHFSPAPLQEEVIRREIWRDVSYLGYIGRESVAQQLATARVGLSILHPIKNYQESYPIKVFEYMAFGVPVVASNFSLWKSLIEDVGCGLVVDPLNPEAIADAILEILQNPKRASEMGARGQELIATRYNWSFEGKRLLEFYQRSIL